MRHRLVILCACLLFIGKVTAQNDEGVEEIPQAEVMINHSDMIVPLQTKDFVDTLKISKWKDYWDLTGIVGLNFSTTWLWNWAAGGNNNINGVVYANMSLTYKKGKLAWDNHLDTELGEMYTDKRTTIFPNRKSTDRINFSTKLGFEFKKTWFVTVLGSFKSQYIKGFEYTLVDKVEKEIYNSRWLSPSYSDLSVGIDWKPNKTFSIYLSPVAGRITTCTEDAPGFRTKYGISDTTKSFQADLGLTIKASVNFIKIKDFKVISSIAMFTPYTNKEQPFGNFDIDWDLAVSYQFLKVLNVSLFTSLKYYDLVQITDKRGNVGPRVQFKTIIGIGIGYSF